MVQRICEMPDDHFGVPIPLAPCSRTLAVLSPGVSHTTVEEKGKREDGGSVAVGVCGRSAVGLEVENGARVGPLEHATVQRGRWRDQRRPSVRSRNPNPRRALLTLTPPKPNYNYNYSVSL